MVSRSLKPAFESKQKLLQEAKGSLVQQLPNCESDNSPYQSARAKNRAAPIYTLPNELIAAIFDACRRYNRNFTSFLISHHTPSEEVSPRFTEVLEMDNRSLSPIRLKRSTPISTARPDVLLEIGIHPRFGYTTAC
jgi:hypothetical protein